MPGFLHQKREPGTLVKLIAAAEFLPYRLADLIRGLGLEELEQLELGRLRAPLAALDEMSQIARGERHYTLLRYASKYAHQGMPLPVVRWIVRGMDHDLCE